MHLVVARVPTGRLPARPVLQDPGDDGSGLKGCTVTQVPCGLWFVFSLHCEDGGTLLWIFTTWYSVAPVELVGPETPDRRQAAGEVGDLGHGGHEGTPIEVRPGVGGRGGEQFDGTAPRRDGALLLDVEAGAPRRRLRVGLVPRLVAGPHTGVVAPLALGPCVVEAAERLGGHALLTVERLLVRDRDEAERQLDGLLVVAQQELGEVLLGRLGPDVGEERRLPGAGGPM